MGSSSVKDEQRGAFLLQTMVGLYKNDLSRSEQRPGPDVGTPAQSIHQTVGISLNFLINAGKHNFLAWEVVAVSLRS